MPRVTRPKIHNLNTYRDGYSIEKADKFYIDTKTGDRTPVDIDTRQQTLANILDGMTTFRLMGGTETLTFTVSPTALDTIVLKLVSISPDREQSYLYLWTIKFRSNYDFTKWINL